MRTKRIVHFSDTRGQEVHVGKRDIPRCDILIFSGNCTAAGGLFQFEEFLKWFAKQPAEYRIFIGGNRDGCLERFMEYIQITVRTFLNSDYLNNYYLFNSSIEIDGLKIHGSPTYRHSMKDMNHYSFGLFADKAVENIYNNIPKDTDVLITSEAPNGILDVNEKGEHIGSESLKDLVDSLPNLKAHCFGKHINHGMYETYKTRFFNGNMLNESLQLENHPHIFDVEYD